MRIRFTEIRIVNRPSTLLTPELNDQLQWLGDSLGLFSMRDKDKSCFRIFIELLKSAKLKKGLSSDKLAYHLNLTRGTVVHHLNKLMDYGIVVLDKNLYYLEVSNLEELIEHVRKNINHTLDSLDGVAKEIDRKLRLD